jgi:hypothetical protein
MAASAIVVSCSHHGPQTGVITAPRTSAVPVVVDLQPEQVRRVILTSPLSRVEVIRNGDGTWAAGAGTSKVATTNMDEIDHRVFPVLAFRAFRVDRLDPLYGLTPPGLKVTVEDGAGRSVELGIGSPSFTGGGVYAALAGTSQVFLLARAAVADLRSLLPEAPPAPAPFAKTFEQLSGQVDPDNAVGHPWLRQALEADGLLQPYLLAAQQEQAAAQAQFAEPNSGVPAGLPTVQPGSGP